MKKFKINNVQFEAHDDFESVRKVFPWISVKEYNEIRGIKPEKKSEKKKLSDKSFKNNISDK
jgi:hypothetical protein